MADPTPTTASDSRPRRPRAGRSLLLAAILMLTGLGSGHAQQGEGKSFDEMTAEEQAEVIAAIRGELQLLLEDYRTLERKVIPTEPFDPVVGNASSPVSLGHPRRYGANCLLVAAPPSTPEHAKASAELPEQDS